MEDPNKSQKRCCVECDDAPAAIICKECKDEFCELCFSWVHQTGNRAKHSATTISGEALNKEGTTRAFASGNSLSRSQVVQVLASNQIGIEGSISGDEAMGALTDRVRFIPIRLNESERDFLRLLEGTLKVSEYSDHVDVTSNDYGFGWSFHSNYTKKKENKMKTCLNEVFRLMLGLNLCFDFKDGQKRVKEELGKNADFFQTLFEVGRRYKIMNPDKMRSTYGKLMCILQDIANPDVYDFECNEPIVTVFSFLEKREKLGLLRDVGLLEKACNVPDLRVMSLDEQKNFSELRRKAVNELKEKHVNKDFSEVELELVLNSISDGNAYVAHCRHPVDKMINYLKKYFDPHSAESEADSLSIRSGSQGSCLSHDHSTQFKFVMQSLQLWREIQNQMFRLWIAADADLQDQKRPYRLYNTGQGLHRVQSAQRVSQVMQEILGTVKGRVGGWVGLSVVHLGDRDVPNALVFIDKYTQVPRILSPIILAIERIGVMCCEEPSVAAHVEKEYGGVEKLRKHVLRDFFRHGFDGSGDDGGSCVDGRLTSCWNWCSLLNKKDYSHIFLLTGFEGFDGSFRTN